MEYVPSTIPKKLFCLRLNNSVKSKAQASNHNGQRETAECIIQLFHFNVFKKNISIFQYNKQKMNTFLYTHTDNYFIYPTSLHLTLDLSLPCSIFYDLLRSIDTELLCKILQ